MIQPLKRALRNSIKSANLQLRTKLSFRALAAEDETFLTLFPGNAKLRRIAGGFGFTEGPVWLPGENALLFSDIPGNRIYRWEPNGKLSIYREPSHNSNGLTLDPLGRLIACEHGTRRVTRTELDGSIKVLADSYQGKPLNSPNDVVTARDGTIFFTDPPYGIRPDQQELPYQGVYRITTEGELECLSRDFDRPNGLCFNLDETSLFVDDSSSRCHIRQVVNATAGTPNEAKVWFEMSRPGLSGDPDGMKLDQHGRLFCTGPEGVWVFSPDGAHLGTIRLPELPANLAWGDEDGKGLYITARTSVYHLRTEHGGARPAWR